MASHSGTRLAMCTSPAGEVFPGGGHFVCRATTWDELRMEEHSAGLMLRESTVGQTSATIEQWRSMWDADSMDVQNGHESESV